MVGPGPSERNYHIFYYMVKGASAAERVSACRFKPFGTPTHTPTLTHALRPRLRRRRRLWLSLPFFLFAQTKYGLLDNLSKYAYTKGGEFDAPGTDDSQGWADMKDKLKLLGLSDSEIDGMFQATSHHLPHTSHPPTLLPPPSTLHPPPHTPYPTHPPHTPYPTPRRALLCSTWVTSRSRRRVVTSSP